MSDGMGLSFAHMLILAIVLAIYIVPIVMILRKAGYSGWWVLILFVPLVNIRVFAFANWPILRGPPR